MDTEVVETFIINSITEAYRGQIQCMQDFNGYLQYESQGLRNKIETDGLFHNNPNSYTASAVDIIQPTVTDIQPTNIASTSHSNFNVEDNGDIDTNIQSDRHCFTEAIDNLNKLSSTIETQPSSSDLVLTANTTAHRGINHTTVTPYYPR